MKTTVVNMLHSQWDVRIDRKSVFGNPFLIGKDGERAEVIEKYRRWFHEKIDGDSTFREAVESLRGKRLGCWCAPMACHGDVIVEYVEKNEKPVTSEIKEIIRHNVVRQPFLRHYGMLLDAYLDRSVSHISFLKVNLAVLKSMQGAEKLRTDRPSPTKGDRHLADDRNAADEWWLGAIDKFSKTHGLVLNDEEKDWYWFLKRGEACGAVLEYRSLSRNEVSE